MNVRGPGRRTNVLGGRMPVSVADILFKDVMKKAGLMGDESDVIAQSLQLKVAQIVAIEQNLSLLRVVEAQQ